MTTTTTIVTTTLDSQWRRASGDWAFSSTTRRRRRPEFMITYSYHIVLVLERRFGDFIARRFLRGRMGVPTKNDFAHTCSAADWLFT